MTRLGWWYRYWRAAHYRLAAYVDWYNTPTVEAEDRYLRAAAYTERLEASRP